MLIYVYRMFRYGMSYFIATSFFSKDIRNAVLKLYSFVRIPDNIVDIVDGWFAIKSDTIYCENKKCWFGDGNNVCTHRCRKMLHTHYVHAHKQLSHYYQQWNTAFQKNDIKDEKFGEYVKLFKMYAIPYEYSTLFFQSMLRDCIIDRYQTYEEVEKYMYGSAAVIGLMMCSIMWVHDHRALKYARILWDAMQFTNFLRDVREDAIYLDRVYLPAQDLQTYWLLHEDIINFAQEFDSRDPKKWSAFQSYMKVQIKTCRDLYKQANKWYSYLSLEARKAVSLSSLLYQEILCNIEKNDYDVFSLSAKTTLWDKLRVWWKWKFSY